MELKANCDQDLTEILRAAGAPQNLSQVATAQCFLLLVMLREERKKAPRAAFESDFKPVA